LSSEFDKALVLELAGTGSAGIYGAGYRLISSAVTSVISFVNVVAGSLFRLHPLANRVSLSTRSLMLCMIATLYGAGIGVFLWLFLAAIATWLFGADFAGIEAGVLPLSLLTAATSCRLARLHSLDTASASPASHPRAPIFDLDRFGIDSKDQEHIDKLLPVGFFHGDCWQGNVLIDDSGACVLIDPIQSPWIFGKTRYLLANGAVDLATMHMSLLIGFPMLKLIHLDVDRKLEFDDILLDSCLKFFDARSLRRPVLHLSRAIAIRSVSSYPTRINPIIGRIKVLISQRIIESIAKKGVW
jgi:hypothetical protein